MILPCFRMGQSSDLAGLITSDLHNEAGPLQRGSLVIQRFFDFLCTLLFACFMWNGMIGMLMMQFGFEWNYLFE